MSSSFDKYLCFTIDSVVPHFLDIDIHPDGLGSIVNQLTQVNKLIAPVSPCGTINHYGFRVLCMCSKENIQIDRIKHLYYMDWFSNMDR